MARKLLLSLAVALGLGVSVFAVASPASAAWTGDINVDAPAGLTAGDLEATYTASSGHSATTCPDVTATVTIVATAGVVTESTATLVDGCSYTVTFDRADAAARGMLPPSDIVGITESNPDVTVAAIIPPIAGIGDGVRKDVAGDSIADVLVIAWDYLIEYVPTVFVVFIGLFAFFMGMRLFLAVVSKTSGAFKGLIRRS